MPSSNLQIKSKWRFPYFSDTPEANFGWVTMLKTSCGRCCDVLIACFKWGRKLTWQPIFLAIFNQFANKENMNNYHTCVGPLPFSLPAAFRDLVDTRCLKGNEVGFTTANFNCSPPVESGRDYRQLNMLGQLGEFLHKTCD